MKLIILVLVAVFLFGGLKLPAEHHLFTARAAHHLQSTPLDLNLREQIGQLGFVAALSGFRSVIADFLFIQAHVAWERTEWSRVLFRQVTTLQPRSILFLDMAAWHMAWNASRGCIQRSEATAPGPSDQSAARIF